MAGLSPSLTDICMAAMFIVPSGSVPRKLMNKPVANMRSIFGMNSKNNRKSNYTVEQLVVLPGFFEHLYPILRAHVRNAFGVIAAADTPENKPMLNDHLPRMENSVAGVIHVGGLTAGAIQFNNGKI